MSTSGKEVDQLIEDILHERKTLQHRYGNLYEKFRHDNLANKNPRKDFGHKQNTSKERNINYVYQRNHWNSEQ